MEKIEIKKYDVDNPEYKETGWGAFHIVKRVSKIEEHTQAEFGYFITNSKGEAETIKREIEEVSKETEGWYDLEIQKTRYLTINLYLVFASRYTRYNVMPISKEEF